jgi:O-antigen ligase
MTRHVMPNKLAQRSMIAGRTRITEAPTIVRAANPPLRIIRYAYYAFIFSLPFEALGIGSESGFFSLAKMAGYGFVAVVLTQPKLYLSHPPKAFWCFVAYLFAYVLLGSLQEPELQSMMRSQLMTLIQLLVLFWLSYNMMRYEWIRKNTFLALVVSCVVLVILLQLGITSVLSSTDQMASKYANSGRVSAFGDNPNATANVLTLGLLALVGLVYDRDKVSSMMRLLAWLGLGVIATMIVFTGSRGAIIAIMVGFSPFFLRAKRVPAWLKARLRGLKLKAGLTVAVAIILVIGVSYYYEPARKRWEQTIVEGSLASREKIFPAAVGMFLESPLFGWGPVRHYYELGSRLGDQIREPHNLYLYILIETGLLGGIPFFMGMWYCCRAAWKARSRIHRVLPLSMLLALLIINMKGTWHYRKLFWIVLAYALVSGNIVALPLPGLRKAAELPRRSAAAAVQQSAILG